MIVLQLTLFATASPQPALCPKNYIRGSVTVSAPYRGCELYAQMGVMWMWDDADRKPDNSPADSAARGTAHLVISFAPVNTDLRSCVTGACAHLVATIRTSSPATWTSARLLGRQPAATWTCR